MSPSWLRLPGEVATCVACGSPDLRSLDVIPLARSGGRRRAALLDGCAACGVLFVNPMPDRQELDAFYAADGGWAGEHADRAQQLAKAHARVLRKGAKVRPVPPKRAALLNALAAHVPVFAPPPGARVLDFGCGDGKLLNTLQEAGWETYGVEPSSEIAFLRHQRLSEAPRDASFDLVILHHVLEHVSHPIALLEQLAAALRGGGILSIIVPRFDTLPRHGDYRYCINGRNHLLAFTEVCLRGLLLRAGLEPLAVLDSQSLDDLFTSGEPMRLRVVARRRQAGQERAAGSDRRLVRREAAASHDLQLPDRPLEAAIAALARYRASHLTRTTRLAAMVPPRLRAAWMVRQR